MNDSIFTKIINGEIPAHYVYQDDDYIAILDIHPIQPGHTLVIPKKQIPRFTDMNTKEFNGLMAVSRKIAQHIQNILGCERMILNIDGADTPDHVHVHLVPANGPDDSYREGRMDEEPDHTMLHSMATKIKIES